jgi:hypothetical protein
MKKALTLALVIMSLTTQAQDSTYQLSVPPVRISIDIPDVVINGTKLKRKATLFTMTYNQSAKYLALSWTVSYYADSAGSYGQSLAEIAPSYSRESIADNNTFVNPATGEILTADSAGHYSMNYMGQYDWFNMLAENQTIQVHNLIRQYGYMITDWKN